LAFDGTHLYYTLAGGSDIHQITTTGQLVGTITPVCSGAALLDRPLAALAYDASEPLATLWAATDDEGPPIIVRVSISSGLVIETIDSLPVNPGDPFPGRINGLALDPTDHSLFYSTVLGLEVLNVSAIGGSGCTPAPALQNAARGFVQSQGDLSGHAFDGQRLFSGQPVDFAGEKNTYPPPQILVTSSDSPSNIFNFQPVTIAGTPLASEDLAFDGVTFAPDCAIWAIGSADGSTRLGAFEVLCLGACPWDCGAVDDVVGTADLLALLGQWSGEGSCDFDGGGVGSSDLLALLTNWGPCP
jgi:hypothetical protein